MAKPNELSPTMQEALALVPADWAPVTRRVCLGRRLIHVLSDKTFAALQERGLVEFKGEPGCWKWRRVDPRRDPAAEATREARETIAALENERADLKGRITAAENRICDINSEIARLEGQIQHSAAA